MLKITKKQKKTATLSCCCWTRRLLMFEWHGRDLNLLLREMHGTLRMQPDNLSTYEFQRYELRAFVLWMNLQLCCLCHVCVPQAARRLKSAISKKQQLTSSKDVGHWHIYEKVNDTLCHCACPNTGAEYDPWTTTDTLGDMASATPQAGSEVDVLCGPLAKSDSNRFDARQRCGVWFSKKDIVVT